MIEYLVAHPDQANAMAAVATAIVTAITALLAVLSIYVSLRAMSIQDIHNQLSFRPIPWFSCGDYIDHIYVKLVNKGVGPLIVRWFNAANDSECADDLISLMPYSDGIVWTDFVTEISGQVLQPGEELILIDLNISALEDYMKDMLNYRSICRKKLGDITVHVSYTDVYGNKFPSCSRKLEWFHRP